METLWKEKRPPLFNLFYKSRTQADWAPIRTSPYKTCLRSFNIEAESVTKLLTACRQHNTTITSMFHSLMLVSLASHVKSAPAFASGTPLDLRRFIPTNHPKYPWFRPERAIANYVTVMNHDFPATLVTQIRSKLQATPADEGLSADVERLIWSVATKVREEIRDKLTMGMKNDMLGAAKFVGDWRAQLKDQARRPRQHSWIVTNLGVLEGNSKPKADSASQAEGGWSISHAQFIIPTEVTSAALMISLVTVSGGQLCVTCSWQDCVVDTTLAESVMVDMERWLVQIAS